MTDEASAPQRISASPDGMVVTAKAEATAAGASVLADGGNAVDAAVAAALALGVCEPQACGLGGQTMMLIHLADERRTFAVDGSSRAPSRATIEQLSRKRTQRYGYRATTLPSSPAALAYAAQRYGKLTWARLLEPAIALAQYGYEITPLQEALQRRQLERWREGNAAELFLKEGRDPYSAGDLFRQPVLARTLRQLAEHGVEDFYQGDIARRICEDMQANDGFIQQDDLGLIPWPIERKPVSCRFEELRVHTFGPPGAGRTLIEMLNILGNFQDKQRDFDRPEGALLLAEVIRRSQLDRQDRPFDPNFYPQVDLHRMMSVDYAKRVSRQIKSRLSASARARKSQGGLEVPAHKEKPEGAGETTHLSVMDAAGNVVGLTQSIERVYGAYVTTPSLGFLYNNYMSAFEYSDYTHPYYLRPNGVPWASVAPTIVFRGRRPWAVLGSPGSERITSSVLQVLLRLRTQPPMGAVAAPRLHCSAGGKISFEAAWMRDDLPAAFTGHGFTVDVREPFAFYLGCVQLALRDGRTFVGVADPRRDGTASGPRK